MSRRRLQDRLTAGTAGPLTLITGPAGAGKTALAAAWTVRAARCPVVWLTVEGHDRAPGVFWAYVLEAFHHHHVSLPAEVGTPAHPGTVDHSLLARLATALTCLSHPVVLVLDGLDQVPAREVASGLDFVLSHAGPQLRLVLISRIDPPLPLHRYRADGRICEIRGGDLAFTRKETATLLRRHGPALRDDSVSALVGRTEGWAAGLRLCALAMQRTEDPNGFARSFAASQHAVADYLLSEVLDAQSAATRDLLMRSSILERVHPELADALTGRDDAEWILAGLTRANAFVERVGDTAWHRYHPLFAEVLQAHLRSSLPGVAPRLHRVAAHWFMDNGRLSDALTHATAAGEWGYAAEWMVGHLATGRFLTGPDTHHLDRIFSGMPASVPGAAPALVGAARALARHDTASCRTRLGQAGERLRRAGAQPSAEALLAHTLLRLLTAPGGEGDSDAFPAAEALAGRTGELMRQVSQTRLREHPEIEALRRYGLARALMSAGRLDDAHGQFGAAVTSCAADTTQAVRHRCLAELALIESLTGALGQAERRALDALAIAEEHGVPLAQRTGACHLALAVVASERGDPWGAHRHLGQAAGAPDAEHDPVCVAAGAVIRSRVDLARGNGRAALDAIDTADASGGEAPRPRGGAVAPDSGPPRHRFRPPPSAPWPAARMAMARAALHVADGAPRKAITVLRDVGPCGPAHTVALAEAHLCAGEADSALSLLAQLRHRHDVGVSDHVRALLLQARAATLAKDFATAGGLLGQALSVARPERLRRPFIEADPWLGHLFQARADLAEAHSWLTERPGGAGGKPSAHHGHPGPVLVERLSDREREVLQYASQMLSTEEIAMELHLSANTVKTHLKNIYRKLSVSRRSEAVRRAREFGLL